MDIVALRIFIYSILPSSSLSARLASTRAVEVASERSRLSCCNSLVLVWPEVELAAFSATSSSQTRSPNPSAGRPGILFSLRSALPVWQSVFLELSQWAAAMGSVRQRSLP
jgi:hypothetical protein